VYIPRFCWHPRMKPVGMCRMCLVEIKGPRGFSLQPACFVPAAEEMEVITTSEKVKKAQDGVLEFLLVNHPLDCPVCDRGGECPLQDQTFGFGPGEGRLIEEKRHFAKPIAISDLVPLDRQRRIQCPRCTRFPAGSGGWPRASQPTSYLLGRYLGIDSEPVNHGWLCDKGRFSYEAVDHDERLGSPMVRREDDRLAECTWAEALGAVTGELRNIIDLHGPGSVAVLGGARLTNEAAYAWAKLAKGVIGTDSVDCQLGDGL